jgi:hypothetical protein
VIAEFNKILRAEIGQFMLLPVTPEVFDRVEFRSISGQAFQFEPGALAGGPALDQAAAVRRKAVPDDQQLAWDVAQKVGKKLNYLGTANGAWEEPEIKLPPGYPGHGREQLPIEVVLQHWSLPARRPGAAAVGPFAQSAFVDEDDGLARPAGFFLSCGQRFFFQRLIACSSRSSARPTGRWQLQPNWPNRRHTCAGW